MKIISFMNSKGKFHQCIHRSRSHASLLSRLEVMYVETLSSENLFVERGRNAVDAVVKAARKRSAEVIELNLLGVDLEVSSQLLFGRDSKQWMYLRKWSCHGKTRCCLRPSNAWCCRARR
jgi:hypothetical protein